MMIKDRIKGNLIAAVIFSVFLFLPERVFSEEVSRLQKASIDPDQYEYRIGPEDVLEIDVWKNSDLSKVVIVRPDGKISLPLIGDVKAAGTTPDQLRKEITKMLERYQETVVVSVIVSEINSYKVYVLGEVVNPGTYTVKRKTTLLQAIALAGGFTQFASRNKIMLIREKGGPNGKENKMSVRFKDIVYKKKKTDKNMILNPGDTVFVP